MTRRIKYKAPTNPTFGEHEIDYIFLIEADVNLDNINENEVCEVAYLDQDELKEMLSTLDEKGLQFSPWGKLIVNNFMYPWWPAFMNRKQDGEALAKQVETDVIHSFSDEECLRL